MTGNGKQADHGFSWPAFLILATGVVLLSACAGKASRIAELTTTSCAEPLAAVARIQGVGPVSPLLGESVRLRGIVTRIEAGRGLYLEQPESDASPATANGLFVALQSVPADLRSGDRLQLGGRVTELHQADVRDGLTALVDVRLEGVCERGLDLPLTRVRLPLSAERREALEAMRITFEPELAVTDVYRLVEDGQLRLAPGQPLITPTETRPPGPEAARAAREQLNHMLDVQLPLNDFPDGRDTAVTAKVGDRVQGLYGVLSQHYGRYRLLAESRPRIRATGSHQLIDKAPDNIRVVSFNLYNFFNGNGLGGGFPTERGAETYAAFQQQRRLLVNAIRVSQADVVAVQEIENDGFGPNSAISDLKTALEDAIPGSRWRFSRPVTERLGEDVISVGILYRGDRLRALGPALTTSTGPFADLNRQPLAQILATPDGRDGFMLVVNHFKSKGGCPGEQEPDPENANRGDGQACWNATRVKAAAELAGWLNNLRNIAGAHKTLVVGDFNSYRMEDPIRAFKARGYTELVERFTPPPHHSFVYRGRSGSLDYAFANPMLLEQVQQAAIWHINAGLAPGRPFVASDYLRSSDHDPVIVDLGLTTAKP